jgi:hypothetical protein
VAPGYPAAAARPVKSSCKIEEKLTASRPRYGWLMALSGFGAPRTATEAEPASVVLAGIL